MANQKGAVSTATRISVERKKKGDCIKEEIFFELEVGVR